MWLEHEWFKRGGVKGYSGQEFYEQDYWNVFVSDGVFRLTLGNIGLKLWREC